VPARRRPDLADSTGTLARVYADPRLFGFIPGNPAAVSCDTMVEGPKMRGATGEIVPVEEFMPLRSDAGPSWWEYNHNGGVWDRTDTLVALTQPEQDAVLTARMMNMPVARLRTLNEARGDLMETFTPARYGSEVLASVVPGTGIFFHGWTLVAERVEILPKDANQSPRMQTNPRFLWLSIGGSGTLIWEKGPPASVDQCLDGVEGILEFKPLQLCGPNIQIGDIYTTWTYLSVDSADVGRHVRSPIPAQRDRCRFSGVLPAFPTGTFSILAQFEVRAERELDQLKLVRGKDEVVGLYGQADGVNDLIQFTITMSVGAPVVARTQYLEIYYMRGVGEVARRTGIVDRPTTRLKRAMINGRMADNVEYHD